MANFGWRALSAGCVAVVTAVVCAHALAAPARGAASYGAMGAGSLPSSSSSSSCVEVSANGPDRAADRVSTQQLGDAVADPQTQLQNLVREAARRSADVGAARLLAAAAEDDLAEVRGARKPQVVMFGTAALASNNVSDRPRSQGFQGNVGLNVSTPVFDGGRLDALDAWRQRLVEAARQGKDATEERVALEAVNTALERHRYRLQAQVYQQYVRKMGCLVEALEIIVSEDKGRASELVQARKSQRQAELQRELSLATARQFEVRLRKLVGEQVTLGEGISSPLMATPELDEVRRLVERSADLQKLMVEAQAQDEYARAVGTGQKPQVNWTMGESLSKVPSARTNALSVGVQFSWQLYDGGSNAAATRAALKRADASRQSYQEALSSRIAKVNEQHDGAVSAFERARRYAEVMRDSERVRNFTFQQWSQLGRRSLFDVMSAESDHFAQRVGYINALVDGAQANASLRSQGVGLLRWLGAQP